MLVNRISFLWNVFNSPLGGWGIKRDNKSH
jgi:hypothetical protein